MSSKDLPPSISSSASIMYRSSRAKPRFPPKDTDLSRKVAIVTGSNTGLGLECGRQLLALKISILVITSRSEEKGNAALLGLKAEYPDADVQVWPLDMSSYDSIQAFTKRAASDLPHLDIAILNAGVNNTKYQVVPATGHEELMQVNYLSTTLLSLLLLPVLKDKSSPGSPGRLSIVTSGTALFSTFLNTHQGPVLKAFDDVKTAPPAGMPTYSTSKLMGHMFVYKLVDYVSAEDVIVNLVDPGLTRGTSLGRALPKVAQLVIDPIMRGIARTLRDGASTYLDACVVRGKESHGCFLLDWEIQPFPALLYTQHGKQVVDTLWEETMEELAFADARGIVWSIKGGLESTK